jgi:hypothetical protein
MTAVSEEQRTRALLSVQRALLGAVSPAVRAVVVELQGSALTVTAYFDGEVSEDDIESFSCVEAEIMADFPEQRVEVRCDRRDAPQMIPAAGIWAYQRRE